MKLNRLLIYSSLLALSIAGCKKDNKNLGPAPGGDNTDTTKHNPPPPPPPEPFSITETFESGSKAGYADGNVTLSTGSWDFNDALIGNLAGDAKDGNWSVRLRTGDLAMNFDVKNVTQISFKHAKYGSDANPDWQLLMSTDGGANYTLLASISETSNTLKTDSFAVTGNPAKVRFEFKKTSATVRVNIDDITFKGLGDPGITVGDGGDPDTTGTSTPAGARNVTVGADAPPASGDNSNLLMGNPSGAQTSLAMGDNYLIDQGYYTESYSASRGEPNWVSWHLDASNTTGATGRLDNFAAWAGLPTSFYAVQSNSYSGSGFDRGHNCPSADRTSSANANSATFLMTNMIPQAPQNNEQTWNNMEGDLRALIGQGNELYIIMGSYGVGGTGSKGLATVVNGNSHITVPAHVWKVAIVLPVGNGDLSRITADTRVIAVDTPNDNSIDRDWTKYTTTIQNIENVTGYSLLSALPQNVRAALEVKTSGI